MITAEDTQHHLLAEITLPNHPLIKPVWQAFSQIEFAMPVSAWLTNEVHLFEHMPRVQIWRAPGMDNWELLAGFRTFNLANVSGQTSLHVVKHDDISATFAMELAIRDVLIPLLAWDIAGKNTAQKIASFCKLLRAGLPADQHMCFPSVSDIRGWLDLSKHVGRRSKPSPSRLEVLRSSCIPAESNIPGKL